MRLATLPDYTWLYSHGYMPDGLACARAIIPDIVERCPATFLDYGCGRGDLVRWINSKTTGSALGFDPATDWNVARMKGESAWIISCDVLEHIPADEIDDTLKMLGAWAANGLLLTIANMSDVHLINGEQVELHLIQEPMPWWTDKLREHFPAATIKGRPIDAKGDRFAIVVEF
jgi:hypothetical protein